MISLWTAATGMESMKFKIEVIANNLANTNTDGFKRSTVDFSDLLYQYRRGASTQDNPTGISVGLGVKVAGTTIEHKQGSLKVTENQTDWAINGRGFFRFLDPISGLPVYSRNGTMKNAPPSRRTNTSRRRPIITRPRMDAAKRISRTGMSRRQSKSKSIVRPGKCALCASRERMMWCARSIRV